jgi:hypothetical protein
MWTYFDVNTASGRQAGWRMLQYICDALYPRGVRVKLIACRKPKRSAPGIFARNARMPETANVAPKEVRDFLRNHLRSIGKAGGRARQARLTKTERRELARRAARARWSRERANG